MASELSSCKIINDGNAILTQWSDGSESRFHAIWLRDNASDGSTRDPNNGQRLITASELDINTRIQRVQLSDQGQLHIAFVGEDRSIPFEPEWLQMHRYDQKPTRSAGNEPGWLNNHIECWDRDSAVVSEISWQDASNDQSRLHHWLAAVYRYGFATMHNGPEHDGAVLDVAGLFGFVRETNYGKLFDVKTTTNPTNLAFTGLALQAHTDNPYRDPVPSLQILYCMQNSSAGGDSIVVDGFRIAHRLRADSPEYFKVLSQYCAQFEFTGDSGAYLHARKPVIELAPDGELVGIRFNNRATAAITDVPYDQMTLYYAALQRFSELADDPAMQLQFKLQPGSCFIVDNTRVLHGRTGYTGEGNRWLQGCYADKDGLLSTMTMLDPRRQITHPISG